MPSKAAALAAGLLLRRAELTANAYEPSPEPAICAA